MKLHEKLLERERMNAPITVGLVGAGQMGTGLVSQVASMKGMRVSAIADIVIERARRAFLAAGVPEQAIVMADDVATADEALTAGRRVITRSADLLPQLAGLEAIIEATGVPELGARIAWLSILGRKHIVSMNVEADVTVGPLLKRMADVGGVVYTGAAGDEPAATLELYEFAQALGLTILCAGKGKNNPLDRRATPDSLAAEARARGMSPRMLCSFVDGTKTMVEMAALANATGLRPSRRGLHGPQTDIEQLTKVFALRYQGGILEEAGVVDYAIGNVAPGVFVVFTSDLPVVIDELRYLKMGDGPNWVLYRPYHLTSLETPLSVARAVLNGEPTIAPTHGMVAEVIAVAKRRLRAGEQIDGIGGSMIYGLIERAEIARAEQLLPIGIAQGAILRTDIEQGQPLTYTDVMLDENQTVVQLRRLQDQWLLTASSGAMVTSLSGGRE
ncbi:NAD(P)H-dependent oxidoreductase [Chloroflexus sp.]|uniref:NAD(P)H-dependent oxidoreductase n=1 Tax=Chloroflexus sp. TaxID=1904827 RepID=UPI00298EE910|nr:SAF domain-containing protein [Chloroflexus sp.]MDW8403484.1 SAF domain-containing protein [Chloroflexus sp.]